MKILIAGGSGQIGRVLERWFINQGHQVLILTRTPSQPNERAWDSASLGPWATEIDGCDIVINLAGRSVNCRYTKDNLKQMMDSRVNSARVIGQAIGQAKSPPKLWLQMSTATIYAHTFGEANDEISGTIGGNEPDVPAYWKLSIDIAQAWEAAQGNAPTPHTRKVALRTAMMMSADSGGVFDVLSGLAKRGLGGTIAGGKQYMSWIHPTDFCRAIDFVIDHQELEGAINFSSPNPLPQKEFARLHRKALGVKLGLPTAGWMVKLGAVFLRTDAELVLKSRRAFPKRLLDAGFSFEYPDWKVAVEELAKAWRKP